MSTERPILMAGPLVVATLEGRKTQTRRIIKPWPEFIGGKGEEADPACWGWPCPSGAWVVLDQSLWPYHGPDHSTSGECYAAACRYGEIGERLWVREAWRTTAEWDGISPSRMRDMALAAGYEDAFGPVKYGAGGEKNADLLGPSSSFGTAWGRLRPSIHMPRWASRAVLVVDAVRAERVQDISEEDTRAEGVSQGPDGWWNGSTHSIKGTPKAYPSAVQAFADLWDSINGKRPGCSWRDNPWIWAITYHVEK